MSLLVDDVAAFGPGPHEVLPGIVDKVAVENPFPGLSGTRVLALGQGARRIVQRGVLVGTSSSQSGADSALSSIEQAIEAIVQDAVHTLTDGFGRTWANVVLLRCRTAASRKIDLVGTQWTVSEAYEAEWLQVTV